MAIIKWGLMLLGCLALLIVGGAWSAIHYFKSAPTEQMSMADLQYGGRVLPGEREALVNACHKGFDKALGAKAQNACACIASRAEQNLSRFSRLTLTAGLTGDVTRVIAIGKGMAAAGVSNEAITAANERQKAELKPLMTQCMGAG